MFYEMTIAGLKRQLPLCKVTDDLYIAAFIMFSDVEITKAAAGELLKRAPQFDIMITAESKGIPLAYETHLLADVFIRKKCPLGVPFGLADVEHTTVLAGILYFFVFLSYR